MLALAAVTLMLCTSALAATWPTSRAAHYWRFPHWWFTQAWCIHRHESIDWHQRGALYSGGLQFLDSTYASVGGSGRAADWSIREQMFRAWLVYRRDGNSWAEWGTAGACHLR